VLLDVDAADLARALGRPVTSWDVEALDPDLRIHSVTGGVYRVTAGPDSLVVKVVRHGVDADPGGLWVSGGEQSHRNYWKREWLAFHTGLLDALPGRLRAPRTLLTTQPRDDECWIWMEDVTCRPGTQWSLDDFAGAAHHLGTTQGAFAAGATPLPDAEWLSRHWLRGWVDACSRLTDELRDHDSLRDERLAALRPLRGRIIELWSAREQLLAIVDAAPPTLVHCDFWPTNLFRCDDDTTVAVDWSQVGIGAVAQDLDQITLDTVWMHVRPDESLDALEQRIVPSYLRGLHDAGCDVNEGEVRFWYAAAAAAHYPWMAGMQVVRSRDPVDVARQETRFGWSFERLVANRARVIERAVELGEWALESGA
jgi:hypothetical protein